MSLDPILIRPCEGFEELSACVELQVEVWGYGDRDVVPRRVFIVSKQIGGQVMGAFDTSLPGASPEGNRVTQARAGRWCRWRTSRRYWLCSPRTAHIAGTLWMVRMASRSGIRSPHCRL